MSTMATTHALDRVALCGEASRRALDVVDGMARWVLDPTDPDANRAAWL